MDSAFAAIRWAILERGSENVTWLLSDERLGDHCCRLLYEMKIAAAANLELAVRLLACAHLDAWLAGLCISEATLTARGVSTNPARADQRHDGRGAPVCGKAARPLPLVPAAARRQESAPVMSGASPRTPRTMTGVAWPSGAQSLMARSLAWRMAAVRSQWRSPRHGYFEIHHLASIDAQPIPALQVRSKSCGDERPVVRALRALQLI